MAKHRLGNSESSRPAKRTRNDDNGGGGGSKGFFAGLGSLTSTVPQAAESDFEDDAEALEYLRSVRYVLFGRFQNRNQLALTFAN
jgi:hypothetical protein